MSNSASRAATQARKRIGSLAADLAALRGMTTGELARQYQELFGEPTRSRNKDYLRKRLAWRIQELAEGGLSERALARIDELAATTPPRWRSRRKDSAPADGGANNRDPRIPPPGTILRRDYMPVSYTFHP